MARGQRFDVIRLCPSRNFDDLITVQKGVKIFLNTLHKVLQKLASFLGGSGRRGKFLGARVWVFWSSIGFARNLLFYSMRGRCVDDEGGRVFVRISCRRLRSRVCGYLEG